MARLVSCSVCCRIHPKDYICDAKKKRNLHKKKGRVDEGVYNTRKWKNLRNDILEDYNYICLYSLYKENRIVRANHVHHIIEICNREELAYEESNLIPLSEDKHRLVHELYKGNKEEIQSELREMKERWDKGDRGEY